MTTRARVALAALALLAALAATTAPVHTPTAAPAPERAPASSVVPIVRSDGVEGRVDTYSSQISGAQIWDLEVVGTRMYAAGKFTKVVEAGGSWPRHDQPFLAAFDTRTGDWIRSWRPRVDAPAYALERLPNGSILVGGEFTVANGHRSEGLVALNPDTGATDHRFSGTVGRPNSEHPAVVRDLFRRGRMVYVVGQFSRATSAGGPNLMVTKAVRFNVGNGVPDARWRPRIEGRSAYAVVLSGNGRRVHIGGEFTRVGRARGTSQLATVNAKNGGLVRGWDHGSNAGFFRPPWPVGGIVLDLAVKGKNLFVTGAEHFYELRDARNGRKIHLQRIRNDGQTVEIVGNRAYIGCHCYHRTPERQVWEVNATTGRIYRGRTGALMSGDGTWATAVAPDRCLWLGGDFMAATAVRGLGTGKFWVGRLARLCPRGVGESSGAESSRGPVNPPWWTPPPSPTG